MKETTRIKEMATDLYNGSPWIDVTILGTLENISHTEASSNLFGLNSIWQLIIHIVSWRKLNMQRLQGLKINTPSNNFIGPVNDCSEGAWRNLIKELETSQFEWEKFISSMKDEDLEKVNEVNKMSYYKQVHGIIQHDAYHLGQIVLISKLVKNVRQ